MFGFRRTHSLDVELSASGYTKKPKAEGEDEEKTEGKGDDDAAFEQV